MHSSTEGTRFTHKLDGKWQMATLKLAPTHRAVPNLISVVVVTLMLVPTSACRFEQCIRIRIRQNAVRCLWSRKSSDKSFAP